ncbi:phage tail protein [Photobacterium carnosum]|uniref:phage tail protein n=1 Tax=Photobacterium carnosum TaxID=2023717 RepID=UPI00242BA3A7|nr:phage tail protein [Photobacterium carnosum]
MTGNLLHENTTYMAEIAKCYKRVLSDKLGSTGKDLFDCVITKGTFVPSFKDMGDGIIVGRFDYEAVFMFEALPAGKLDPRILMASTATWLLENDTERQGLKLPPPKIDIDAYSNDGGPVSDMEITLEFSEPITMKETAANMGDVFYNGKWWGIAPYVIHVAEEVRVIGNGS